MAALPSYREATARPDWLALAAPYVDVADYASLCLVCRRAWSLFAPPLWADVFAAARRAGLDPGDDLTWWLGFVFHRLRHVAPATRALVRVLDARHFAKHAYHHFAPDGQDSSLEQSFGHALRLLPSAAALLLDGHGDLDPASLLLSAPGHRLRLLSIADCPGPLPAALWAAPGLQSLVYLDVSGLPGSMVPLLQPGLLPHLRVLKARARELDDATFSALAPSFQHRLWSLDLSDNNVTDAIIQPLRDWCIPPTLLRSEAYFRVEGRLVPLSYGTPDHGPFLSIDESQLSAAFSHPERHLVDAPAYAACAPAHAFRSDGASPLRDDSADASARVLSQHETDLDLQGFCTSHGITHLRLSNTHISSLGIQKLLRISSGQLEDFACDSMPLLPASSRCLERWPASARLCGILGASHLFRPVFSSNLRALRIHHSLVTHVPTLEADGLSMLARLYLAETSILERVDKAYPQAFVPDMNPRLTRLTLTCIPRRSSGPLIAKLLHFIQLLSMQERAMQDGAAGSSGRSPRTLQGLRHLALEFEPDAMDDALLATEAWDAEDYVDGGDAQAFSFFADEWAQERRRPASRPFAAPAASHSGATANGDRDSRECQVTYHGEWNGQEFSVPVWAGPNAPGSSPVLADYRRLVVGHGLQEGVGPATPSQVLAGAPDASYVFHTAWCAAVMPPELVAPPPGALAGMKDVLAELKAHRHAARASFSALQRQAADAGRRVALGAPHFFWTGTLRVSARPHPSRGWR